MAKKAKRKYVTLEQWVQITVKDGKTVTRLYPSNEEMMKRLKAMDQPPDMVYRRLNFVNGVPNEYSWATPDPVRRKNGGHGIQRMAVETWLKTIQAEELINNGHVGSCEQMLPRPKSRGGCDCPSCTANRARYERRGITVP